MYLKVNMTVCGTFNHSNDYPYTFISKQVQNLLLDVGKLPASPLKVPFCRPRAESARFSTSLVCLSQMNPLFTQKVILQKLGQTSGAVRLVNISTFCITF